MSPPPSATDAAPQGEIPPTDGAVEWTEEPATIQFRDSIGRPAYVIHWSVLAEPDVVTVVSRAFAGGDLLELYIIVESSGRLSSLPGFSTASTREMIVPETSVDGTFREMGLIAPGGPLRFIFDNRNAGRGKTVHLLVIFHDFEPGAGR